jgi:hypothetical protein
MSKQHSFLSTKLGFFFLLTGCGNTPAEEHIPDIENKEQSESTILEEKTQTALKFMNAYVENCNQMASAIEVVAWVDARDEVTLDFRNELKKIMDEAYASDPEMGLGADPLFDAQDWPEEGFEVDAIEEGTEYVTLKGKNWPQFKVTLKVIDKNGKWLIDGCGMVNIPEDKKADQ